MKLVHDDPDFAQLLAIVARDAGVDAALVEKDYWVTHCLWGLQEAGLELWFKGGTSLSKGLADEMVLQKDSAALPRPDDPALLLADAARHAEVVRAYERIAPMFWGARIPLDEACATIAAWVNDLGR
jgi:hypothetical protein